MSNYDYGVAEVVRLLKPQSVQASSRTLTSSATLKRKSAKALAHGYCDENRLLAPQLVQKP